MVNPDRAACVKLSNEIVKMGVPFDAIIAEMEQYGADSFGNMPEESFAELRSDLEPWADALIVVTNTTAKITELGGGEFLGRFYSNVGSTGVTDSTFEQLESVGVQMVDYVKVLEAQ